MDSNQALEGVDVHQPGLCDVPVGPEGPPLYLQEGESFLVGPSLVDVANNTRVDSINPVKAVGTAGLEPRGRQGSRCRGMLWGCRDRLGGGGRWGGRWSQLIGGRGSSLGHGQLKRGRVPNHRRIGHHGVMLRAGDDGNVDLVGVVVTSGRGDISDTGGAAQGSHIRGVIVSGTDVGDMASAAAVGADWRGSTGTSGRHLDSGVL